MAPQRIKDNAAPTQMRFNPPHHVNALPCIVVRSIGKHCFGALPAHSVEWTVLKYCMLSLKKVKACALMQITRMPLRLWLAKTLKRILCPFLCQRETTSVSTGRKIFSINNHSCSEWFPYDLCIFLPLLKVSSVKTAYLFFSFICMFPFCAKLLSSQHSSEIQVFPQCSSWLIVLMAFHDIWLQKNASSCNFIGL